MNLFKILFYLQRGDKGLFDVPIEDQKKFINNIPDPSNDIERSFAQYICQNYYIAKWKVFLKNLISLFLILPYLVYAFLKTITSKNNKLEVKEDAIGTFKGMEEIIPNVLIEEYSIRNIGLDIEGGLALTMDDLVFLSCVFRKSKWHFFFFLKICVILSRYSGLIREYNPRAIIVHNECSFCSSIMTLYCERRNILHINVMHGEKLFFMRDAFFRFHKCYVWNQYYVDLFTQLRTEKSQFIINIPKSLHIDVEKYKNENSFADFKYYLGFYTENRIKKIADILYLLKRNGYTIRLRPHPRYSDLNVLKKYVDESDIEYPTDVHIMESISNVNYAVGSYSTVLTQAFFSGKKVVVDDDSDYDEYKKLKDYGYILSSFQTLKISNFIESKNDKTVY